MTARKHAILSASSANRWMNCNPSARLEQEFEDRETEAAVRNRLKKIQERFKIFKQ